MKLLGAALLVLSGLLWGLGRSAELRRRVELLTDLLRLIRQLAAEIAYSARPLPELLQRSPSRFCQKAAERPSFGADPRTALEEAGEALLRDPGDRALFRDFAAGLGASGAQGQLEHLELCQALAQARLEEARAACREKQRLYVALGLFGGLTVCLVAV